MNPFRIALAPMRGLTTGGFMDVLRDYGEPTEYVSEFLRVHSTSGLTKEVLNLIESRKSLANLHIQLLGRNPGDFVRIAELLYRRGIGAININLGCPMPKIRKKGVGGALLSDLKLINDILSLLFSETSLSVSVKTRIGYHSADEFVDILECLCQHKISTLYVHLRTVKGLYSESPNFECAKIAKSICSCPVIINGDIKAAKSAIQVVDQVGIDGVMIGRAAVSNPWIFRQIGELVADKSMLIPMGDDFLDYIGRIKAFVRNLVTSEARQVAAMKKYIVPVAEFVDAIGDFSHKIRRADDLLSFMHTCEKYFGKSGAYSTKIFD